MLRRFFILAMFAAAQACFADQADRPQTPHPPYPYQSEEVAYSSAPGVTLSATLTIPDGKGPFPAVLLLPGSGPVDRDETYLGHKPFAVLSDYLTRRGFVTLRADKRGRGKSGGDYHAATTHDFAVDAAAGLAFLKARREVDPHKTGITGHSEGGIIGPMVAAKDRSVAFVVTIGGPALRGEVILPLQKAIDMRGHGAPEAVIAKSAVTDAKIFALAKGPGAEAEVRAAIKALLTADDPSLPPPAVEGLSGAFASPWMRAFLPLDPAEALQQVQAPILMIFGDKDTQVPSGENLPVAKAALAHNTRARVLVMPGKNHLLQNAVTGLEDEYGKINETMAPDAMAEIANWIAQQTR